MWQHAHQALAKAVVALDGSDGSNARDDVNIILRGMSGWLKRLTVVSADSYLIPTLLKRDMVLGKSALPEATKKQLRLGALSDSVLGPVAQTAATGERKRRQEDGIVRLCQTQYKAFSQSRLLQCASVPRRAQVAPSSLLRDSAEIASRLSGLGSLGSLHPLRQLHRVGALQHVASVGASLFKGRPFHGKASQPFTRGSRSGKVSGWLSGWLMGFP